MPSPLGHALAGLAAGLMLNPSRTNREASVAAARAAGAWNARVAVARHVPGGAWVAAAIAAAPDLDLLVPHLHRGATHSLGATALVMIIAAAVTGKVTGRVDWRWVLAAGLAHGSHVLLDWLGTDRNFPSGIEALWPFSHRFYVSGLDVFPPTERRLWLPQAYPINARAIVTELVTLGPFVLAGAVRRTGRSRARTSAPGTRRQPSA